MAATRVSAYAVAVAASLLAVCLREGIDAAFATRPFFTPYYPAVMVAALYGGAGPGLLAFLLCSVAGAVLWAGARPELVSGAGWLAVAGSIATLLAIVIASVFVRRRYDRAEASRADALVRSRDLLRVEEEYCGWRDRLHAALSACGRVLYDRNMRTGELRWSGDLDRLLGHGSEQLSDFGHWVGLIHPDDRAGFERWSRGDPGASRHYRYRVRGLDGDYLEVEECGGLVLGEGPPRPYRVGILTRHS